MWGCFYCRQDVVAEEVVFPTHVGVFPMFVTMYITSLGLPHACGGVSIPSYRSSFQRSSSPRMWGCFQFLCHCTYIQIVFPTHVGVFLFVTTSMNWLARLPHACGGVSGVRQRNVSTERVFPTHVGVFPPKSILIWYLESLPHACGGVSQDAGFSALRTQSSPRMWGCFFNAFRDTEEYRVFPTHVGVFLPSVE